MSEMEGDENALHRARNAVNEEPPANQDQPLAPLVDNVDGPVDDAPIPHILGIDDPRRIK